MRGFLAPSLRSNPTETQDAFRALSRNRRSKLAETSQTNLLKASQWARGETVAPQVAEELDKHVKAHLAKRKA